MDINNLNFNVVDDYIDTGNYLFIPNKTFNYLITTPFVFNYLKRKAYYEFANLITIEILVKLNTYIITKIKHLRTKYKKLKYKTKLLKYIKNLCI